MTAVIMTSAIVVLLAFTRAAFGSAVADELAPSSDRSLTYLYYYSPTEEAVSGGGNVRRPTASVLSRLYVAEVDHRRRLEGDDERPAIVEIGPPVRLPAHQRMYNNETDMNAELDQWRSRYSSTVTAAKSIAFDTARGQVLLHSRSHTEDRVFSLVAAGVCPGERLRTPGGNGQWSKYGAPVSGEQRRGFEVDEIFDEANIQPTNYKASSFAVYDGVVYFILEYVNRVDTYENELSIELRRLNGWRQVNRPATTPSGSNNDTESNPEGSCEAQFASKVTHESYFDIKVCSQLVAVIIRERYQKFAHYQSLEGLHIVSSGKSLHFYMQLQHLLYDATGRNLSEVSVGLYHFHMGETSTRTRRSTKTIQETVYQEPGSAWRQPVAVCLHTVSLQSTEFIRYILYQRGALSSLGGILCWSAIDRVLCGRMSPTTGSVTDVRTRLNSTQAATVCKGSGALARVVTGVALVEADSSQQSSLAFFFGCVAETAGMGGAGLFVAGPNDAVGKVYRVRSNGSDIQAASVFVASSALACPSSAFPAAAPQQVAGSGSDRSALTHAQWSLAFAVVAAWAVLLRL